MDSIWHIDNVDFAGIARAYYKKFIGRREGASTVGEMVGRELRAAHPDPKAPIFLELPRKLASWGDGPALAALFPGDDMLDAAAIHLPLLIGLRGASFGPEVHGLGLATQTLFGHRLAALDPIEAAVEAALFAASVNTPLIVSYPDDSKSQATAQKRFARVKARADRCLAKAPFPSDFDRAGARARLAALDLPTSAAG